MLERPDAGSPWIELFELLCISANLGTETGPGPSNTLADHAYAVLGASFVDVAGGVMVLDPKTVDSQLASIDAARSTVMLRNPHGSNEPGMPSNQQDLDPNDGVFQLTLDQYLRNFSSQQFARVEDTA